jgi:ABC-type multidrug transport system fused ATPase/permease subunit
MGDTRFTSLIPILQMAIGPAILISGVGLLLLTMTNRFGRIIDRSRILAEQRRSGDREQRRRAERQAAILWRRATLVRRAITLAAISVLGSAMLVILLFGAAFARVDAGWAVVAVFSGSLAALIGSLVAFIQEINQSLLALRLDLFEDRGPAGDEREAAR